MPAQREVDEATISRQVKKIAEGIRTKDLEGLRARADWCDLRGFGVS